MEFVMKDGAERVLALLAASGFSDSTIREGLMEFSLQGEEEVIRRIHGLRRRRMSTSLEIPFEEDKQNSSASERREHIIRQVVRLLQFEAHLSAPIAAKRLTESLSSSTNQKLPRLKDKEGLSSWLTRVVRELPPSVLLHHASMIRNAVVHSNPPAWPLRDRGE
jgi:hypothetical protein